MKSYTLTSVLLLCSCLVNAQIEEYKASNGKIYHIGDTIKLGRGSGINGRFVYLQWASILMMSSDPEANGVPVTYAGVNVLVKKINHYKKRGQDLTYLTLATMTVPLKLSLNIEPAIATCEIADCKKPEQVSSKSDKFDRLKKAKELLDSGAITQEEYDKEKAKILADN